MKLMIGPKGAPWIAMPSMKRVDGDGRPILGADGKPTYDNIVEFKDRASRERFRDLILDVLRHDHAELFDGAR